MKDEAALVASDQSGMPPEDDQSGRPEALDDQSGMLNADQTGNEPIVLIVDSQITGSPAGTIGHNR